MAMTKGKQIDPVETYAEVVKLRARADELEAVAFRAALERAGWREKTAADILGLVHNTFRSKLHRRHPELAEEAAAARKAMGYTTGNPKLWEKTGSK